MARPRFGLLLVLVAALALGCLLSPGVVRSEENNRLDGLEDVPMESLQAALRSWDGLAQAWFRLRAGDAHGARKEVQALLASRPGDPDALHLLGIVLAAEGRWRQAISALRRSLRRRPDGWACLQLVNLLLDHGRVVRARRIARKTAAQLPENLNVRRAGAYVLIARGDLEAGLQGLEDLEASHPTPEVAYQLSVLLGESGFREEAAAAIRRAVQRDPDNGAYRRELFERLLDLEDWEALIDAGSSAGSGAAGPGLAAYYRGLARSHLGRTDQAIRDFSEVAEHGRPDLMALIGSAGHLFRLGQFVAAEKATRLALGARSKDAALHHLLAMALTRQGRESEGLAHYRRAVDEEADDATYRFDLLTSLCQLSRLEELEDGLGKAGKDFPEDPRFGELAAACLPPEDGESGP